MLDPNLNSSLNIDLLTFSFLTIAVWIHICSIQVIKFRHYNGVMSLTTRMWFNVDLGRKLCKMKTPHHSMTWLVKCQYPCVCVDSTTFYYVFYAWIATLSLVLKMISLKVWNMVLLLFVSNVNPDLHTHFNRSDTHLFLFWKLIADDTFILCM